jgi:7-alpha-hydroxysteroid dehydrogenase
MQEATDAVTAGAFRLDGRVAIVTGAGQGIGATTALAFAESGADVVLVARTATDLDSVAEQVRARGVRALTIPGDVNDLELLASVVERTVDELHRLDIVVNNAGGTASRPFPATTVDQLESSFHFNVSVAFELSRVALPHLLDSGAGAIVNIGSVAGRKAVRGTFAHSLSKATVAQLTRLMAAELAPRVRVNAVLPGAVETNALRRYVEPDTLQRMTQRTAMRRNGTPEDIALAVLFLVAPAASWITGKLLEVDGLADDDLIPKDIPDL